METNRVLQQHAIVDSVTVKLLGISPRMEALRGAIAKVAHLRESVLVTGEIGSGKALVADLIHQHSDRGSGPFVSIRGAAATARFFQTPASHAGRPDVEPTLDISAADGGTLFIQEIGDLTPEAQTALLLYLQQDGSEAHEPRTRLVSSTHANLEQRSHAGAFREDLFYRIASLRLDVPPLRERGPDVGLLAMHFLADFSGTRDLQFDESAQRELARHPWPGNVRELRNRVLQASVMCESDLLTAQWLGLSETTQAPTPAVAHVSLRETRHVAEREAINQALRESHGQVPAAAASLGISRAQLYRLIGRLHVDHHLAYDELDQNGISSSGKGSSLRAAGALAPEAPRSPP